LNLLQLLDLRQHLQALGLELLLLGQLLQC
jgi:hypothetical protein